MSNYIGVRCPVCNKKFTQTDDIVVCPICGAPHHRECYAVKRECAFAAEHIAGREWRPPAPEPVHETEPRPNPSNPDAAACAACKSPNPKGAFFCQTCGRPLQHESGGQNPYQGGDEWGFPGVGPFGFGFGVNQPSLMYGGLSPDDVIDDIPVRDLALYIGENPAYYLAHFKRMDETSRTLSFNFSSLIFGFFYFFYRKMYILGCILLVLFAVSAIPAVLMMREYLPHMLYLYGLGPDLPVNRAVMEHYQWLGNITSTINLVIGAVISFCANRFYFMKTIYDIKKIRSRRSEPPDERVYAESLVRKGGVSRAAVTAVICLIFMAYMLVTILISGYTGVIK